MESLGLIRTLVFVLVMCAITVVPAVVILGSVYLLQRSMTRKRPAGAIMDDKSPDAPAGA